MRILSVITLLFAGLTPLLGQNQLFPVAKNGKWGLVSSSGKFILDYRYDYIDYIPAGRKYVYEYKGKKGLIDESGTLLSAPTFDEIEVFDTAFVAFKTNSKWGLSRHTAVLHSAQFDSITQINDFIYILYKGNTGKLYHTKIEKETEQFFLRVEPFEKNLLIAEQENGKKTILNTNTLDVLTTTCDSISSIGFNYAKLEIGNNKQLINLKKQQVIGIEVDEISYLFGHYFLCTQHGKTLIFSAMDEKYDEMTAADAIIDVDYPLVYYFKANKQGVWSLTQKRDLIPPNYEGLEEVGDVYLATDMGRYGVFSSQGQSIIPLIYDEITLHDRLYIVTKNGRQGVLTSNGKTVVPTEYEKINVYESYLKCYSNEAITIVKLDENGNYKSQKTYTDYFSIDIEKERTPLKKSSAMNFGGQEKSNNYYESFGWYKPILKKMVGDSVVEYRGKWGLKDTADSVVINPHYEELFIREQFGFTEAYTKPRINRNISLFGTDIQAGFKFGKVTSANYQPPFHLVHLNNRKRMGKTTFYALSTTDFNHYHLARAFDGNLILVDRDANTHWEEIRFYSAYRENILRICQDGERLFTETKTPNTICTTTDFLNLTGAVITRTNRTENFVEVKDGHWFYVDSTGKKLNETPFEMAEDFLHHLAIVKLHGKWGVVDTGMHIIIPFEHDQVERVIVDKKSYFKISNRVDENYIYTKNGGTLHESPVAKLDYFHHGKWFAQTKNNPKWALVDSTLNPLTAYAFDQVQPFENGYASVMKSGKKTLIDENGHELFPYLKCKQIETLGYDRFAVTGKRGITLINTHGDTLLEDNVCKSIIANSADYVVYQTRGKELSILNFKNSNTLPKKYRLISFSLKDDLFLVQKEGKTRLFSLETGKFVSKALPNIVSIGEGSMIYRNNKGLLGYISFSGDTLCPPQFKTLENSLNGWAFGQKEKEKGLVDINGNFLFEKPIFRVNPLGENFVIMTTDGVGLIDPFGKLLIPAEYVRIEPHNGQFYKALKMNKSCDIYTLTGTRINDKSFQDINAITEAAFIVTHEGFDYLYNGALNKSLSFQRISPVSSNLYLLHENRLWGLYTGQGELIIPIQYHKIDVVHNHFQVSFFNSFGYYNLEGKLLADPREVG